MASSKIWRLTNFFIYLCASMILISTYFSLKTWYIPRISTPEGDFEFMDNFGHWRSPNFVKKSFADIFVKYENHSLFQNWREHQVIVEGCVGFSTVTISGPVADFGNVTLVKSQTFQEDAPLTITDTHDMKGKPVYSASGDFITGCSKAEFSKPIIKSARGEDLRFFVKSRDNFQQAKITDDECDDVISGTTIILTGRLEYTNIYWTLMDVYNAVLTCTFYKISPDDVTILMYDAFPYSLLDPLWNIFRRVIRFRELKSKTKFRRMIFAPWREYAPLLNRNAKSPIPGLDEYKILVHNLHRGEVQNFTDETCNEENFNILLILRRDYAPFKRAILRKFRNETEIIQTLKSSFPKGKLTAIQMDQISIHDQLRLISETDILIGMHGSAMSFSLLMRRGGAAVEVAPEGNWHMGHLAAMNGVRHVAVEGGDVYEKEWVKVNVTKLIQATRKAQRAVCAQEADDTD